MHNVKKGKPLQLHSKQCERVRTVLKHLSERIGGHDSWPANFLATQRGGCPIHFIDMTQFIWDVIPQGDTNRTGDLFGEKPPDFGDIQPAALRFMPPVLGPAARHDAYNWWPNCRVLERALSCEQLCN